MSRLVTLWARCEGWVKIGQCKSVVVDERSGEVRDEARRLWLRRVDGSWEADVVERYAGWRFDQVAVTGGEAPDAGVRALKRRRVQDTRKGDPDTPELPGSCE